MTKRLLLILLFVGAAASATSQPTILIDAFTNSHCGPCWTMHNVVDADIKGTSRGMNAVVVYNHLPIYLDDELYQHNRTEPVQRAQFLGGVSGTPTVFVGGTRSAGSGGITSLVDAELAKEQSFSISTTTSVVDGEVIAMVTVQRLDESIDDITLYGIVVEDVMYAGRNNVTDRKNVYRKALTLASGSALEFDEENRATITLKTAVNAVWDMSKVSVVVAVQSPTTKKVYEAQEQPLEVVSSVQEVDRTVPVERVEVFTITGERLAEVTMPNGVTSTADIDASVRKVVSVTSPVLVVEYRGGVPAGRMTLLP